MDKEPVKFIQLTDTHLFSGSDDELLGVNTENSLRAVLSEMKSQLRDVSFILHTGDISQDHSQESYQKLANLLSPLKLPVYYIPGNHDDLDVMNKTYPLLLMQTKKQIVLSSWQLILLNSHQPGAVEGYLKMNELDWIDRCIKEYPSHYVLIALHHQPVKIGCQWLDNLGLVNAAEFWDFLKLYPQVRVVLFGHVHQESMHEVNNIQVYSTPSTCIQFMRQQNEFGLENIPQGYRIVTLYANGTIATEVKRIESYSGNFQKNATGY